MCALLVMPLVRVLVCAHVPPFRWCSCSTVQQQQVQLFSSSLPLPTSNMRVCQERYVRHDSLTCIQKNVSNKNIGPYSGDEPARGTFLKLRVNRRSKCPQINGFIPVFTAYQYCIFCRDIWHFLSPLPPKRGAGFWYLKGRVPFEFYHCLLLKTFSKLCALSKERRAPPKKLITITIAIA